VLAVVEHQQQVLRPQGANQHVDQRVAAWLGQAKALGERLDDMARVGQRGELNQNDAVRRCPGVAQMVGQPHRQAGLARPAGSGDGHQPGSVESSGDLLEIVLAADKRIQLARQVRALERCWLQRRTPIELTRRWARPLARPRAQQPIAIGPLEFQRNRQPTRRCRMRMQTRTTLEIGDTTRAETGPFGQLVLRQPRRHPIAVQQRSERFALGTGRAQPRPPSVFGHRRQRIQRLRAGRRDQRRVRHR
jgi:hypothetical protein